MAFGVTAFECRGPADAPIAVIVVSDEAADSDGCCKPRTLSAGCAV